MPDVPLLVRLDAPLPGELAVGAGTALFVAGTCVAARGPIAELAVTVDGTPQRVTAHGMPRRDNGRSGFWATVRIGPRAGTGSVTLGLRARLADDSVADAPLGEIALATLPAPLALEAPAPDDGPLVAICLAAFDPDPGLLRRQLDSIRAQTHRNWVCVISDDHPTGVVEAAVAGDARFAVSRAPRRLGFYRNFERALALAPAAAPFIALADQDDSWHPDKLAVLLRERGAARLVYSDARLAAPDGHIVGDTYWAGRRNEHDDLRALLVANCVPGASALFERALIDVALPFPPAQFAHYHDHWLALCARATGDIAYVDRPLYDYVQHDGAVLGHAAATSGAGLTERVAGALHAPAARLRVYGDHYFTDVARLTQFATVLLERAGPAMAPAQRQALGDFLAADGSPARAAALWLRGVRDGLGTPATMGAERGLAYALAWRWVARDAAPPADLTVRPSVTARRR